jgi:hypothetical protein
MPSARSKLTEVDVRYRIEQAFQLAPCMTIGMLSAFLNARVSPDIRTSVLEQLKREGKIVAENRTFRSRRGHTSTAIVLKWVSGQ